LAEKNGNYQIVLSTRLDTTKIKSDLKKLEDFKLNVSVNMTEKSLDKLRELNKLLNETKALNNFTNGLVNIQKTMKSYEKIAAKTLTATKNLSDGLQSVGTKSLKAAGHVKTFGEKISEAFQKFSLWSVVSAIFYKVVRSVEQLVNTAIELDKSFTELTKVTDLTIDDFDELTQKAYNLGSTVAKTTSEVIDAMTEFAKAGYSVEESTNILAKNALIWTNISDGTISAADSANMIISVMKAFNMEAEETTHIIDALNEVSNNYAISSGDLSDSLAKSSAVLANAGVTFEEQLGLITAGTEILRNANTVSTGLRTISLRLQGMEEDGTKVSGLTAKLEGDFNKLGLTLYDANGNLKDTYDILADLAEIFPSLNTEQKAYYTELIAGKTRAQVAAAVLNNFDRAVEATGTALDSAGSAAEENAKVLDSLNGHIKAFRAEWESLVNSKATQDTLKMFVDFGTAIVKLINSIGGLKTVIIGLSVALVAHKVAALGAATATTTLGVASVKTMTSMQLFSLGLKTIKANILSTIAGLKLYAATTAKTSTALITASQATQLASARMVVFGGKIALVAAALLALVAIVNKVKQKINEWKEAEKEKDREIVAGAKEAYSRTKELYDTYEKYKQLSDNTNRSYEQEEAYANAIRDVADALGYKTSELTDATIKQKEYVEMLDKAYEAELRNSLGSVAGSIPIQEKALKDKVNDSEFKKKYNVYSIAVDGLDLYLGSLKEVKDTEEEYNKLVDSGTVTKEKAREQVFKYNATYEDSKGIIEEIKDDTDNLINSHVQQEVIYAKLNGTLPKTAEEQENFANSIVDTFDVSDDLRGVLYDIVFKLLPALPKKEDIAIVYVKEVKEEIESLKELSDAYSVLESAMEEYNENGKISAATLQKLIMEYPEYIQYLVDENGNIKLNKDAIDKLVASRKEEIKASIIQDALNRIDNLKRETEEEKALAQQIEKTTEEIKKNNQARFEALALLPAEDLGQDAEKIKEILNEAAEKIALLNKLFVGGSGSGGGKSKTTDAWKEAFTKAYNELKNRRDKDLIETAEYIDELEKLNEKYFKDRVGYEEDFSKYELEVYKERKNLLNEYIDDLEHEFKMLENQGASEEVLIAKYKEIQDELHRQAEYYRSLHIDENNDLIQKLKEQWWKYQKDIEKLQKQISDNIKEELDNQLDATKKKFADLRDVALDAIEKQIDEKNDWLEEQNKMIDDQIDKLKEETDNMEDQKEIQDKLLKIEEARKKLAEAKNKKVRVYREGRGFVYEQDFDAVSSAQQELDNLLEDWNLFQEKARIDDIISGLEKEKDANKERVNQEISDLNRLKDAWDKSLDLEKDVEDYLGWLERIRNSENKNFDERLAAVKTFAESYRNEMALLREQYELNGLEFKEGNPYATNSGYGYKSYNGVDYNPNTDYQDLINKAVASGAPQDHLAYLEKQRNAKIMGEGITAYSPTYKYTTKESSTPSYSPSAASYVSSSLNSGSSSSWKPDAATDVGAPVSSTKSSSKKSSSSSSSKSSGSVIVDVAKSAVNTAVNFFKKITGLADGTVDADGLPHFVGENGPEFYVPPKGSSVIPNNLTSNLMAWGSISPSNLVASFSGGGGTSIEIGNISLPNVTDGESFVEELKNFKNIAIQSQTVRK
jgi:TP901 family phage tail tape measure protein